MKEYHVIDWRNRRWLKFRSELTGVKLHCAIAKAIGDNWFSIVEPTTHDQTIEL